MTTKKTTKGPTYLELIKQVIKSENEKNDKVKPISRTLITKKVAALKNGYEFDNGKYKIPPKMRTYINSALKKGVTNQDLIQIRQSFKLVKKAESKKKKTSKKA